jgi:DNA gyrase subunit A
MRTRDNDAVRHLVVGDTHDNLIFFTDRGRCFQLRAYDLPEEARPARGTPLINLISLEQQERITAVVRCPPQTGHDYMLIATRLGEVKKTPLDNFAAVRRDGLIAMNLEPNDELVAVRLVSDDDQVILVTARGQALRFAVGPLRSASRLSGGVRGIKLAPGDSVVGMDVLRPKGALLVVSARGYGKRTPLEGYPLHGRGGQGVVTFNVIPSTGDLTAARVVDGAQELMLISEEGIVLRTPVAHISLQGRPTQGVKLMDISEGDTVAAVTVIDLRCGFTEPDPLPTGATVKAGELGQKGKAEARSRAAPAQGSKAAKGSETGRSGRKGR